MTFSQNLARALAPVAVVAMAAPAAAQSGDIAKVEAHLSAVQSMTANFVQTDAKGRSARGTVQLKRPGRIRFQYQGNDLLLVANGSRSQRLSTCSSPSCAKSCAVRRAVRSSSRRSRSAAGSCATSIIRRQPEHLHELLTIRAEKCGNDSSAFDRRRRSGSAQR